MPHRPETRPEKVIAASRVYERKSQVVAESGGRHGIFVPLLTGRGERFTIFENVSEQPATQKPSAVFQWQWAVHEPSYLRSAANRDRTREVQRYRSVRLVGREVSTLYELFIDLTEDGSESFLTLSSKQYRPVLRTRSLLQVPSQGEIYVELLVRLNLRELNCVVFPTHFWLPKMMASLAGVRVMACLPAKAHRKTSHLSPLFPL